MLQIKSHWLIVIGILAGVGGGYLYWQQIGCVTGTCPITSSPVNSSLYGGVMGGLVFSLFKKQNKEKNEPRENNPE